MESNTESFDQYENVDNGKEQLEGVRDILTRIIYDKSVALADFTCGRKITTDHVKSAFSFVLPKGELYESARSHAESKVKEAFETTTMERVDMRKPKVEIAPRPKMSDAGTLYLDSLVSYIIDLIVSLAKTQTPHGYGVTVRENSSLKDMFEINKISFLSNTVAPYLSFGLYRKSKMDGMETPEETADEDDEDGGSRKSKILGIVNSLQEKGDCIILPRSAMSRLIREICLDIDPSSKVGMDTPIYLQYIIEQDMVNLIRTASYVSYASKSTKLNATDLDIAMSIKYNQLPVEFKC